MAALAAVAGPIRRRSKLMAARSIQGVCQSGWLQASIIGASRVGSVSTNAAMKAGRAAFVAVARVFSAGDAIDGDAAEPSSTAGSLVQPVSPRASLSARLILDDGRAQREAGPACRGAVGGVQAEVVE
ncbi:MAG: hypothetical protein U0992_24875 [Planctomycetaceae bacterium]